MKVKCPHCQKETVYDASNKYRPFCSERCATLDLGAWAEEKYKVPATANADDDSESVNENEDRDSAHTPQLPPKDRLN